MGTSSFVLAGVSGSEDLSLSSACHGAGRAMSRHKAAKLWAGKQVQTELAERGIIVKSPRAAESLKRLHRHIKVSTLSWKLPKKPDSSAELPVSSRLSALRGESSALS